MPNTDKVVRRRTSSFFTRRYRAKKEPQQYQHFEDVLEQVHPFGPYQIFACLCIVFAQIEWTGNLSFVSIVGSAEPDWLCQTFEGSNVTIHQPTNHQSCEFIQKNCKTLTAIQNSTEFNSIVASFRLICKDSYKPDIISIIQALSLLIGAILGGHLGDAFGRQFLFYICQLGICTTSCLTVASTSWTGFAAAQFCNGVLYGIIEVESLTLMMEITNNKYRMIPNACFQTNLANIVVALIAFLTKDWQMYFIFLNLINLPTIMAFMLWHESPRWLLVKGKIGSACNVLNDLTDDRWNGTQVKFTANNLARLQTDQQPRFYSFYHLFSMPRFAKQSSMQILSMVTCAMIGVCYLNVIREFPGSSILIVLLDGSVRLIIPVIIIIADFQIPSFTRKIQFFLSLALMATFFLTAMIMVLCGIPYNSYGVTIVVTLAAMINDSVFWMNIIQVTTQRYPTVIRCCAFGSVYAAKHIGTILGILIFPSILKSAFPAGAFLLPLALILVTMTVGGVLQPETKGKALLDTIDDVDFKRMEKALPRALAKMAAIHRIVHKDRQEKIAAEHKDEWEEWRQHLERNEQDQRLDHGGNQFEQVHRVHKNDSE